MTNLSLDGKAMPQAGQTREVQDQERAAFVQDQSGLKNMYKSYSRIYFGRYLYGFGGEGSC